MTALLELKQKIKEIYGQYEMYILPVMKFVLALVYFLWINANMGYMSRLNNVFLVLILALICSILPSSAMMYIGFVLILVHSYALGIEIAAFMLVLILLMIIFFLRFSGEQNVTFVFTPLSFAFSLPALLPIGSGLMESSLSAIPAGCGVVMCYFFFQSDTEILWCHFNILGADSRTGGSDRNHNRICIKASCLLQICRQGYIGLSNPGKKSSLSCDCNPYRIRIIILHTHHVCTIHISRILEFYIFSGNGDTFTGYRIVHIYHNKPDQKSDENRHDLQGKIPSQLCLLHVSFFLSTDDAVYC